MSRLKVVALISGGKDSLFSILHCIANGHDVVALANLYPAVRAGDDAIEDLESYMYQTIGHAVIPLYQQALGLPLYRQQILGQAVNQDKSYGLAGPGISVDQDETESLVPLLQTVKAAHPEVNAISTGAILSDYQRTRVESVVLRLGLTPLSFLWQWPSLPPCTQSSLLEDMAAVGQDSRIVKVASGGLDDTFLWQNVADARTIARLNKAAARFGTSNQGAVLGEGGEYETLAINGPAPLWKAKIVIEDQHRVVVPGEAGSSSLRFLQPCIAPKDSTTGLGQSVRIPPLLEQRFENVLEQLRQMDVSQRTVTDDLVSGRLPTSVLDVNSQSLATKAEHQVLLPALVGQGSNAAEQTRSIMDRIVTELAGFEHEMTDIAYTSIILRDMAEFASVNDVYGSYFVEPNPPARVTLACAGVLPDDSHLMIAVTSIRDQPQGSRKALHVQSRSYWAPANIGPYSQAVSVPANPEHDNNDAHLIYVSGQIPLRPASMDLPGVDANETGLEGFERQVVLALQHMSRVGQAMSISRWASVVAFVSSEAPEQLLEKASIIRSAWEQMHRSQPQPDSDDEQDEDFDVWYASSRHGGPRITTPHTSAKTTFVEQIPPLYVIRVDSLPRGYGVEWAGYGFTEPLDETTSSPRLPHLQHLLQVFQDRIL